METIIIAIVAVVIAIVITACVTYKLEHSKHEGMLAAIERENELLKKLVNDTKAEAASHLEQVRNDSAQQLLQARTEGKEQVEQTRNEAKEQIERIRRESKEQLREQMEAFRNELENNTMHLLQKRQEELQKGNHEQMDQILNPLRTKLAEMKAAFDASQESNQRQSSAFETALKAMLDQSQQLGQDARQLTEALKNTGKVQGDWGEQLLASILEKSGMRENIEYEKQTNVKGENGDNLRPDVIVHCSDGRNVVVDSKVSLTAFYKYVNADNDAERLEAQKENLQSVRSHVKELVDKNYCKLVKNSVPTVLMFIPNEGSYLLALQSDSNLGTEALQKGVLLVCPTTLMLALRLIVIVWQFERKEENDRKIVKAATDMYEKFCTFTNTFALVGNNLRTAQANYDSAFGQLSTGRGNLLKQMSNLQTLGVTTTKKIAPSIIDEASDTDIVAE